MFNSLTLDEILGEGLHTKRLKQRPVDTLGGGAGGRRGAKGV